jgi:CBS domain-containing protein
MSVKLKTIHAGDVMRREVHWARSDESLRSAARRMREHGIRALLVAGDADSDLPGIMTSKDLVNLLGRHDVAVLDRATVADVTTRPAVCVPQQANLVDCINLMRSHGVRRVPVLDGTTVVGILSSSDVFERALGE